MRPRLTVPARTAVDRRFIRFLAVGGLNTLFGYVVYLAGLAVRLSPEAALLVATCVGAVFNYLTTGRFVFHHRSLSRLAPFVGTYALVYALNAVSIRLLLSGGLPPALAQAVLVPAMATVSFLLFRSFVFKSVRPS